ncbi:MAG: hypothetical protein ABI843_07635 [Dokdonella sp.]
MDAFSYLSVLISIILGLAITQVLKGFRGLMQARSRLRMYWPAVVWSILVLVIAVQSWWAMFGFRHRLDWTFFAFSIVLAQTITLYLMAALVLPDFFGETPIDLRDYYYANHRWFFALLVVLILISLSKNLILTPDLLDKRDLGFHIAFGSGAMVGALSRNDHVNAWLAVLSAIGIGAYIAVLFTHLT